jgi:hypothetical protein
LIHPIGRSSSFINNETRLVRFASYRAHGLHGAALG